MKYKKVGFLKSLANAITDTETLKTPLLIKEATESIQLIEQLHKEIENSDEQKRKKIRKQIKLLELGLKGENSVLFELQNSFLPIHILHDFRIEHNGLSCQIDFVVLTRKFILLIEVKNYYGHILVNEKDEFIRQVFHGKKLALQEGFYSPLRQVERQSQIFESYMKEMGAVSRTPIKSVVVFTNNKTVINTNKASQRVQEKVIRVDNLVSYLKSELQKSSPVHFLDNRMSEMSEYIKASHKEINEEVTEEVELKFLEETIDNQDEAKVKSKPDQQKSTDLENALKQFRLKLANEKNMAAYNIFSNKTLEELISKKPCNHEELKTVTGIGEYKINAFGNDLIFIIKDYMK
ncbi:MULTISPECIES: NERD domain-containing protein [Solibacillus]|uniref:NERD domain-containing protein n=1 Tax=Solibacillus TaxID=648800 RepID=UPI0007FB2EEE|nr:NERD domain-containing protein [Solibacillus silvestris]OBW54612.1 hypothetical protein A9986_13345 [Solibacillus silvestris]